MTCAIVVILLLQSPLPVSTNDDILIDGRYVEACGPVACFTAMRSLGVNATLADAAELCHWKPGERSTLGQMQVGLDEHPDLACSARHLSPHELSRVVILEDCVAIVAVRKSGGDINHTMTVVDYKDKRFLSIDYPELAQLVSIDDLADIWDGEALIVQHAARSRALDRYAMWACICAVAVFGLVASGRFMTRRHTR